MKTYEERTQSVLKKVKTRRRNKKIAMGFAAGALSAAVTALNLVLFLPFGSGLADISGYKTSEYYPLMTQLNALTHPAPKYKNNFEKLRHEVSSFFENFPWLNASRGKGNMSSLPADSGSPPPTASENDAKYEETTNNQTEGVIEGDLLKRSDKFAFYLDWEENAIDYPMNCTGSDESGSGGFGSGGFGEAYDKSEGRGTYAIRVYSIAGKSSEKVSEFFLFPEAGTSFLGYRERAELYLDEACKTLTVITPCYGSDPEAKIQNVYTMVATIDVSNPETPKETGRKYLSGSYISSRVTDGKMLLFSNFRVRSNPDFSDESEYLPQVGEWGNLQSLPMKDIIRPEAASSANYTVTCEIDMETMEVEDCMALLSFSNTLYVSAENIFIARPFTAEYREDRYNFYCRYAATEISCISYAGEGLEYVNSVSVTGSMEDQYQMDEYNGFLRVATTYSQIELSYVYNGQIGEELSALISRYGKDNANLYCISLDNFEIAGSVERFAPAGDRVYSARFDKDMAYVCTAVVRVQITDPVYAFNLSDPKNITYKNTDIIEGYSSSMITFTDDTLLGIGNGANRNILKIELYTEAESTVESVAKYEKMCDFSTLFKSYFIDKERGLIGLGIRDYEQSYNSSERYLLLRYDGYGLTELFNVELAGGNEEKRAFYKDGFIYLFGNDDFAVMEIG